MEEPRLTVTGRGFSVTWNGRHLYSKRDPSSRPERIAASLTLKEKTLYIVPSPLLGYGLSTLLEELPESSMIAAVEVSQELMALCIPAVQPDLISHPQLKWVRMSDNLSAHSFLSEIGPWRFRRIERIDLAGIPEDFRDSYIRLIAFLSQDLASYWRNRHALGRLGRSWVRHIYANVCAQASGKLTSSYLGDYQTKGAIAVVGAGPSLEDSLPFLREQRNLLCILATDTAVAALSDAGVIPDAIVALETQAWNLLDFHGMGGSCIPVLADISSYPPGLSFTGGPAYLYATTFAELGFLQRLSASGAAGPSVPPLGSVGLLAVELALGMADSHVFLTGLDFAYRPGKSHARGSAVHRWESSVRCRLNPTPLWEAGMRRPRRRMADALGNALDTDGVLAGYAALLKDRYAHDERLRVLSPGGLDLGISLISLADAASLLINGSVSSKADSSGLPQKSFTERRKRAKEFIENELAALKGAAAAWDDFAAGRCAADRVVESLQDLDQVFCDFPDEPPLPKSDEAFLVRAISRCRDLISYIERSQSGLSG